MICHHHFWRVSCRYMLQTTILEKLFCSIRCANYLCKWWKRQLWCFCVRIWFVFFVVILILFVNLPHTMSTMRGQRLVQDTPVSSFHCMYLLYIIYSVKLRVLGSNQEGMIWFSYIPIIRPYFSLQIPCSPHMLIYVFMFSFSLLCCVV